MNPLRKKSIAAIIAQGTTDDNMMLSNCFRFEAWENNFPSTCIITRPPKLLKTVISAMTEAFVPGGAHVLSIERQGALKALQKKPLIAKSIIACQKFKFLKKNNTKKHVAARMF